MLIRTCLSYPPLCLWEGDKLLYSAWSFQICSCQLALFSWITDAGSNSLPLLSRPRMTWCPSAGPGTTWTRSSTGWKTGYGRRCSCSSPASTRYELTAGPAKHRVSTRKKPVETVRCSLKIEKVICLKCILWLLKLVIQERFFSRKNPKAIRCWGNKLETCLHSTV